MAAVKEKSKTQVAAEEFLAEVADAGFKVEVKNFGGTGGAVLTLTTTFPAGDHAAYVKADMDAAHLMSAVKVVDYGATWGTTSDGVGGHAGLTDGYYLLNKSGVSKRFVAAVAKAMA